MNSKAKNTSYIWTKSRTWQIKRTFMVLPFRLTLASLKQLIGDTTNDIIVKQNIFDIMKFLSNSEFQKFP